MVESKQGPVIGLFDDRQKAYEAIEALRQAGFGAADVGVGVPNVERPSGPPTWHTGAAFGAMIGALGGVALGPAAILGTTLVGGMVGALLDLGIPEQDARWYQNEVQAGRSVVSVRAGERDDEAREILRRHNGNICRA